ncbi:MAG TPA: hypothetical protein VGM14_15215 [Streptosporangiaceae bacterium]|jgi:hypothetical protein
MRGERLLVNRIRELVESSNPVPANVYQDEAPHQAEIAALLTELRLAPPELPHQQFVDPIPADAKRSPHGRKRRDTAWRVLAPVLSGLAVVAVVTALTVAAGQGPGSKSTPQTPTAAALPRYFVTIGGRSAQSPALQVHRTSTGKIVAKLPFAANVGPIRSVAAGSSGRVFYVAAEQIKRNGRIAIVVYKAQISGHGAWTIAGLPVDKQLANFGQDIVLNQISVSPDGRRLALALQSFVTARQHAEIVVASLNGKGATRVWSAPAVPAIALDPVWTDNHDVAFLWQDQLTGSDKFGGRSQERVLDTSRPGSSLLSAKVLITSDASGAGLMETAFASPGGGPVFASLANDVPAKGNNGVATVRLVWFSPHKSGFTILAVRRAHYHNLPGRDNADTFFRVFGLDQSGQHALVASPGLGMMTILKLTRLPGNHGLVTGAAW